ncbi:MAG: glycosyltransferase [Bdellovibrionales bacterium]
MTLNVYIGTEENQYLPQRVLEYSIKKQAKQPVNVRAIRMDLTKRKGGTNFGFVRFYVPQLNNYEGRAIYVDADQLVCADINELANELNDNNCSVALVNNPEGNFGDKQGAEIRHNQTSVMVLDCARLKDWNPETMFDHVVPNREELKPGQIHYRDFMTLSWYDQSKIQPIDPRWNHYNINRPDTKLTHFSYVREQPWRSPFLNYKAYFDKAMKNKGKGKGSALGQAMKRIASEPKKAEHRLTQFWGDWLRMAVKDGYISRWEVIREVLKGDIHPKFLKCLV